MKTIEEVKEEHLDLTGLMCPLPVVITSEKMRKLQEGQILTVISTDPAFPKPCTAKTTPHLGSISSGMGMSFAFPLRCFSALVPSDIAVKVMK